MKEVINEKTQKSYWIGNTEIKIGCYAHDVVLAAKVKMACKESFISLTRVAKTKSIAIRKTPQKYKLELERNFLNKQCVLSILSARLQVQDFYMEKFNNKY